MTRRRLFENRVGSLEPSQRRAILDSTAAATGVSATEKRDVNAAVTTAATTSAGLEPVGKKPGMT
jgi:hypothetical protein